MRLKFLFILLLFSVTVLGQTSKLSVKGFGEIPVTKQGDSYIVSLGSYGQFALKGNLDDQELRGSINIDQLSQFPGFLVLSKLGLSNINLQVSSEGVLLYSQADTKGALEKLCRLFKITTPQIDVSVLVSKESAQLAAALEFVDGPVQFMSIAETGTSVKFTGASIATTLEPGTAELSVTSNLLIKPTKFDPDLESIYTFSYDLVSQTLTGSGSMMSDWANPLGTSQFLDDESIVFSNAAVELGINMATLAPVNLGLALERGKIFTLDFGVVVSIDPVGKEVAFMGKRDKMNVNDFTTFLREGFGLSIPNVLPDIYYIENPLVLFAPNGGSVGEVEIDKGIALKGIVKVGDAIEGPIDFSFDMENEFKLHMDLDYNFKKFVMNEVRKVDVLAPIADKILSTLQVRELYIDMNGNKDDLQLKGTGTCRFEVFGYSHTISFKASLDPEQIAKSIVDKLKDEAPGIVATVEKIGKGVQEAGKLAKSAISSTSNIAAKYIKLGSTKAQHIHPFDGGEKYCRQHCIPNRANHLVSKVLPTTKEALQIFHDRIIDDLVQIQGVTFIETKRLREELFLAEWNEVVKNTESQWNDIREDKEYVGYFEEPKWAENGGNQFRGIIDERKKEYTNLKNQLYNNLISARLVTSPSCVVIENRYKGSVIFSKGKSVEAAKMSSGNVNANWIVEDVLGTNYVRFKNRSNGTYLHIEQGKLECTEIGIGAHSAMWELVPVEGTPFVKIKNRWKPDLYLHHEWDVLECATIKQGWHSAMWSLSKVDYKPENEYQSKAWNTNGDVTWKQNDVMLVSDNKKYSLVFQVDGNLVLYKYSTIPLWHTNTYNKGATSVRLKRDGNLVVYKGNGGLWSSNSFNKGGETLFLQDDGNLVLHAPGAKTIWATNTADNSTSTSQVQPGKFFKLKNRWKGNYINVENGLGIGEIAPGWHSAMWVFETFEGHVRIKNRWKGTYLNVENGFGCTEIAPGWHSAMWEIEPVEGTNYVRIKNRWKGTYINIENGLNCTEISPDWHSAMWEIDYNVSSDANGIVGVHSKKLSPIEVVYDRGAGCGTFYREGRELKKHCGWRKTWHTVLMVGCTGGSNPEHKILFYDKSNGSAEIYKVDSNGNMNRLQGFDGFSKHWESITWEGSTTCEGLIKFQLPNGYWEKYSCGDNGNIMLHSKQEGN